MRGGTSKMSATPFEQYDPVNYRLDQLSFSAYLNEEAEDNQWQRQALRQALGRAIREELTGRQREKGTLELSLDYSTPAFRDCSVGRYLYAQLAQQGYRKLIFRECSEKHRAYLKKMGFTRTEEGYVKHLA